MNPPWLLEVNTRQNVRILCFRFCRTYIPCVVFPRNLTQQHNYKNVEDTGEAHCISILGTWWHLTAAVHCLNKKLFAGIMPVLYLSYSLATSILSLHQVPSAALTSAYFTFCLCWILPVFFNATTGSNDQIGAGSPTTSVQLAPETATSLPSAGCPQVRLARCTLQTSY